MDLNTTMFGTRPAGRPPLSKTSQLSECHTRVASAQASLMKSPFGPETFLTPRRLESELEGAGRTTASSARGAQKSTRSAGRHVSSSSPRATLDDDALSAGLFGDVGIKVRTHSGRQLISGMVAHGSAEASQLVMLHDVILAVDSKEVSSLKAPGNLHSHTAL